MTPVMFTTMTGGKCAPMSTAQRFARVFSVRVHYAWIVVAICFTVILIGVGVRAAPSVLLVPLEKTFG